LEQDAPKADDTEKKVLIDGKWVPVKSTTAEQPKTAVDPLDNPVKSDTPKTDTPKTDTAVTETPKTDTTAKPFEFEGPKADDGIRIIRVPLERLQRGEFQYNIVIRPNDTIIVPSPKVGEYYIGGHVQRAGVYSLTGRQITLKQAIISAGMFDPLAWPERTELIRRIGKDKELFVRVDLPKVMRGEQSDIYLRPYDTLNVGTNALAPFLASLRGAFRFTYGFGFIYDRNFYDDDNNQNNN
jgi:polysaccharide biosynthesis/export protein